MKTESLLGIDIGTSATKAVLTTPDGQVLGQEERKHALSLPRSGWAEHDAEQTWWQDVRALCSKLAPLAGDGLRGVCVSGIGPCLVPCDGRLQPLRPAILYGIDTRATVEAEELEERFGRDVILERAGSTLSSQALGPKLLWLRRHEPEVWKRTAGWYMASSFIGARLTGAYILDHHSASQCDPLYDLRASSWADDWAAEIVPGPALPELVWPGDQIGTVTDEAADETGLPARTPVFAGTVDAWAEALSAGVRRPGDVMLMYGSTMFLVEVITTETRSPLLWCTQGVEPGRKTLAAGMATSGALTGWLRSLFGKPRWEELTIEAARVPAGSRGLVVLPYFAGERSPLYDPDARGIVAGLTLSHGRSELLRATYEGIAFGIRQVLTTFEHAEPPPRRLVAVGGGTRARLWLQIVSDVLGRPQDVPSQTIGASYGGALLAAIGSKLVPPDTNWATLAEPVIPDPFDGDVYEELFVLFSQLYPATMAVSHRLAALQRQDAPGVDEPVSAGDVLVEPLS